MSDIVWEQVGVDIALPTTTASPIKASHNIRQKEISSSNTMSAEHGTVEAAYSEDSTSDSSELVKKDNWDEEAMVRRMQKGDRLAFQQMYRLYSPRLFQRVLRLTNNFEQAEDCLQQVFTEVVDKMHTYRGDGVFLAWLNRITTNTVFQMFRKQRSKQAFIGKFTDFWRHLGPGGEEQVLAEALFVQEERKQLLHSILEQLDFRKRIVILLCDLEGRTLEDVARELDIPKGTVASRLHNGRRELRTRLLLELHERGLSAEEWIHA